ncbi:hypothetical protein [Luteimonas sp. gir]|uniref:hypothetical protein n=1 Tax=Luteimonas sp. gir TaxID=3127960 RepID=UPI003075C7AB
MHHFDDSSAEGQQNYGPVTQKDVTFNICAAPVPVRAMTLEQIATKLKTSEQIQKRYAIRAWAPGAGMALVALAMLWIGAPSITTAPESSGTPLASLIVLLLSVGTPWLMFRLNFKAWRDERTRRRHRYGSEAQCTFEAISSIRRED